MGAMSGGTADSGDAGDEALADCGASPEVRRTAAELLPPFYRQVKRVARRERNRVGAITMQTTELAHEAYLRMRGSHGYADEATSFGRLLSRCAMRSSTTPRHGLQRSAAVVPTT